MHSVNPGWTRERREKRWTSVLARSALYLTLSSPLLADLAFGQDQGQGTRQEPRQETIQEDSQAVSDARHESRISTTFALNPYLQDSDLTVDVRDGTAVLGGVVPEGIHRELAAEIALSAEGVERVDNQIQVEEQLSAAADSGERSYREIIEDAGITAAIKSKLLWSRYTDGLKTTVDTQRGHVVLEGTAVSEAAKDLAGLLARNTRGVASVENRLSINPEAGESRDGANPRDSAGEQDNDDSGIVTDLRGATDEAGATLSNAWITMKVKSTLLYSDNISGSGIDVSTEDGVVTLSGAVGSESEHALAVELASNVRGVKEVIAQDLLY